MSTKTGERVCYHLLPIYHDCGQLYIERVGALLNDEACKKVPIVLNDFRSQDFIICNLKSTSLTFETVYDTLIITLHYLYNAIQYKT